ncbi:MAG: sigma-70 family RNA polymerase sigma factor [Pseudomonadota bacterium]
MKPLVPSVAEPITDREGRSRDAVFDEIYRTHFRKLVLRLQSLFGSGPPEPEDVAQRAFEQIARRDSIASINDIEAFLWRTAKNVRISELRSSIAREARGEAYTELFFSNDGYQLCPERVFLAKVDIEIAVKVIKQMPPTRRRAYALVRLQGLSHQDAARELGISRPAISKHVARATVELHRALRGSK